MASCGSIIALVESGDDSATIVDQLFYIDDGNDVTEVAKGNFNQFMNHLTQKGVTVIAYSVSVLNLLTRETTVLHRGGTFDRVQIV